MEEWRPVSEWEGFYEVSTLGRVRTIDRTVHFSDGRVRRYPPIVKRTYVDGFGYTKTTLKGQGRNMRVHVHSLVARAWIGPRPVGLVVCHENGVKTDNRAENLRYDTPAANHADAVRHGTATRPRRLTDETVALIRAGRGEATCRALADLHGTSPAHVCNIQLGYRRKD
jgi:HNH endonuclease/NUMOD4 motif